MNAGGASTADKVKYDNSTSGLKATNVQGAVDEVNNSLNEEPVKILDEKTTTGVYTLSKSLSLFKEIAITTLGSGNDYVCVTLPVIVFKEINSITCVNSIDTRLAVLKYVNDTSINQAIVSNAHIYSIYGIK